MISIACNYIKKICEEIYRLTKWRSLDMKMCLALGEKTNCSPLKMVFDDLHLKSMSVYCCALNLTDSQNHPIQLLFYNYTQFLNERKKKVLRTRFLWYSCMFCVSMDYLISMNIALDFIQFEEFNDFYSVICSDCFEILLCCRFTLLQYTK